MKIVFSQKIKSSKDCKAVYEDFRTCLSDSAKSKLWPNEYSSVRIEGKHLIVDYKLGVNYKAIYDIKFLKNKIIYSPANNHPLSGESVISFSKTKKGCVINWEGKYYNANLFHYLFFKIYSFLFFKQLRNLI